jgi:2,4-dienoyl-CoA reductase [(3E)-enoyl-CoA-producing], peroxisomal
VTSAKAGVDALSQQCAIELGPFGITSNVIAPGGIADTEGMRRLSRSSERQDVIKSVPLQRAGTVKDISDATVWICGAAANYVNGLALVVDGGAWRVNISRPGKGFQYPDFLLSGETITGVAGVKKQKSKL